MDLKQILTDIARAIVDTPDAVSVTEKDSARRLVNEFLNNRKTNFRFNMLSTIVYIFGIILFVQFSEKFKYVFMQSMYVGRYLPTY